MTMVCVTQNLIIWCVSFLSYCSRGQKNARVSYFREPK